MVIEHLTRADLEHLRMQGSHGMEELCDLVEKLAKALVYYESPNLNRDWGVECACGELFDSHEVHPAMCIHHQARSLLPLEGTDDGEIEIIHSMYSRCDTPGSESSDFRYINCPQCLELAQAILDRRQLEIRKQELAEVGVPDTCAYPESAAPGCGGDGHDGCEICPFFSEEEEDDGGD